MIERAILFAVVLLALDAYVFKALLPMFSSEEKGLRTVFIVSFWIINVAIIAILFYGMSTFRQSKDESNIAMYALGLFFVFLIPKALLAVFHLLDDVFNFFGWAFSKIGSSDADWSRRSFITKLGLGISGLLFGGLVYGVTKGKYAWRVLDNQLASKRLPASFNGFKVVQISDAHLGSFTRNYEEVDRMVDMINELSPDLIMFTGDLVNEHAREAEGWEPVFARLKAKHGKYSVFGNHDYAHYGPYTEQEQEDSVKRLRAVHQKMGFKLLEDEHVSIQQGGESIRVLGVHNWGKGFGEIGDLPKAMQGTTFEEFKILLSHDPTHFEEQVMGKEQIDLTLSGHTHGMQMGIEIPSLGIKFSPVRLRYKRWGGLYTEGEQHLHVNRGMGVLAFPGRIGMAPEITLITLQNA